MINIDFFTLSSGELVGFKIQGHSGLAESGHDVLCAAVSSAAYLVANTISDVIKADAEIFVSNDGQMYLKLVDFNKNSCRDILLGFKLHVLGLEEQYPENIIVNYMEV